MNYRQEAIPFGRLPLGLILIHTGQVAIARGAFHKAFFDQPEEGLQAAFYEQDFVVSGETFLYNRAYALQGVLKEYIVQQKLDNPFQ